MKKILIIALCAALILALSSCNDRGPEYGNYPEGYADGYADGVFEAQKQISGYAEESFSNISGIDVYDAIQILTNYADGEPISEADLHDAIWKVQQFYYDSQDVIRDLDDYTVE